MKNPFTGAAGKLYETAEKHFRKKENPITKQMLAGLHPLGDPGELYREYEIRRLAAVLAVLLAGTAFVLCLFLQNRLGSGEPEEERLERREWNESEYTVKLQAKVSEFVREISYTVKPREPTQEEMIRMYEELKELLPEKIRGENQDLQHITGNLKLITSAEGYPFSITWFSKNRELVDHNGIINRRLAGEEGTGTMLTAVISGGEQRYRLEYEVFVLPEELSGEEKIGRIIEDELQSADEESRSEKALLLPEWINGEKVYWKMVKGGCELWWMGLVLLTAFFIGKGMDRDLEKNAKKREESLKREYSEFVCRLRLYLSAGLTLKNVFLQLAADYGELLQTGEGKNKYLYEEIQVSCNQLQNGMMEEKVYQDWGKRCGEIKYRRLSFLLSAYLKHGSDRLLTILTQEADRAREDRRNLARKAGEEAGTRLLFPMMLMLAVVICLILLPAYLDFGSI